uniref:NADAR domain-containing protein n=1 Tax=Caenorhabditis japonica TaxID=281687 RepID=A0A8R1DLE9_CAEJA
MHVRVYYHANQGSKKGLVLFYRAGCVFSNFFPAEFQVIDEKNHALEFNTSEQYFMYNKALLVGDNLIASEIMKETSPKKMKLWGRRLKMSKEQLKEWSTVSRDVMYRACREKFAQNQNLRLYLFRTHEMTLAEASPTDKIWGIGLSKDDRRAKNPETWKGANWLGQVLDRVRDELWERNEFSADRKKVEAEDLETRVQFLEKL